MAPRRKTARPRTTPVFVDNPFDQEAIAAHHDAVAAAPWLASLATPGHEPAPSPRPRVLCVLDGVEANYKVLDHFDDEAAKLADEAFYTEDAERREAVFALAQAVKRGRAIAELKLSARLLAVQFPGVDLDVSEEDGPVDDVHGEVKVGGKWVRVADYDLVFVDNEASSCRYLVAGLPPSRVAFVANVKAERQDARGCQVIPATLTALLRRVGDLVADHRRQLVLPWGTEIAYPPAPSADDAAVDEAIVRFAQA